MKMNILPDEVRLNRLLVLQAVQCDIVRFQDPVKHLGILFEHSVPIETRHFFKLKSGFFLLSSENKKGNNIK